MDRWLDWICPGALIIGFLATAPFGRKSWWLADACATLTFGLGLILVPDTILGFQVEGDLDNLHHFICRCLGTLLVGTAVSWYLARNSYDRLMFGSQMLARVGGSSLMLICQVYAYAHQTKQKTGGIHFNDKYLTFGCLGVGLWLLGSLWQLVAQRELGGYIHKLSYLHAGFFFDHYILLVISVLHFAFPNQLLKALLKPGTSVDSVHVALVRQLAALTISISLTSNAAPSFLYARDKKCHVIGRLTSQVLLLLLHIYGHFALQMFSAYHNTPMLLVGFYITFILSLYFRFEKDKEK